MCFFSDTCEDIGLPEGIPLKRVFEASCNVWAHEQCASWSEGVRCRDNVVENVPEAALQAYEYQCPLCKRYGASVKCRACSKHYHFSCATAHGGLLVFTVDTV